MQLMWPLWWVLLFVGIELQAGYTLGQWRELLAVGFWWLGQWQWDSNSWGFVEG